MQLMHVRQVWMDEGWEERAACRGADVELFFSQEEDDQQRALAYCAGCQVRQQCLQSAIKNREIYGIWGGMSESDRRARWTSSRYRSTDWASRRLVRAAVRHR